MPKSLDQDYLNKLLSQDREHEPLPLDVDYARQVVEGAPTLERVQRILPRIHPSVVKLICSQSNDFLFGVATLHQALHDLMAKGILTQIAFYMENDPDNRMHALSSEIVKFIGLIESLGYVACKEIVDRKDARD